MHHSLQQAVRAILYVPCDVINAMLSALMPYNLRQIWVGKLQLKNSHFVFTCFTTLIF